MDIPTTHLQNALHIFVRQFIAQRRLLQFFLCQRIHHFLVRTAALTSIGLSAENINTHNEIVKQCLASNSFNSFNLFSSFICFCQHLSINTVYRLRFLADFDLERDRDRRGSLRSDNARSVGSSSSPSPGDVIVLAAVACWAGRAGGDSSISGLFAVPVVRVFITQSFLSWVFD